MKHKCMTYKKPPADGSIDVKHWQGFAKRLRYYQGPFRFLHCGEYGEVTRRPHYHALIFGLDFFEDRKFFKMSGKYKLYRAECLDEIWGHGFVNIGELTQQSANYVARYTMKKLYGAEGDLFYGERLDLETGEVDLYRAKPYSTMSRRPGIGKPWLDQFMSDVYPRDEVIADGRPTRPPKFYDAQLEASDPAALETIKLERRRNGNKHKSNNTPERLAVREKLLLLKSQDLQREAS